MGSDVNKDTTFNSKAIILKAKAKIDRCITKKLLKSTLINPKTIL